MCKNVRYFAEKEKRGGCKEQMSGYYPDVKEERRGMQKRRTEGIEKEKTAGRPAEENNDALNGKGQRCAIAEPGIWLNRSDALIRSGGTEQAWHG